MNEKRLLFFFAERDGRVRQIVNGVVTSLNKKTALRNNPDGHREIAIIWERNPDRHGMGPNFSLPLGYVLEAATMLQNDFYKFNIDRELYLVCKRFVCEIDDLYYKEYYKHLLTMEFDFSSFVDKRRERKVEMSLMQGGNAKLLKAFEGTISSYPFDDDHVNIHSTGIDLYKTGNFILINGFEISNADYSSFFAPLAFINTDGDSFGIAFQTEQIQNIGGVSWADRVSSENWFAENSELNENDIDLRTYGKIIFQCTKQTSNHGLRIRFIRSNQLEANQGDYDLFFDVDIQVGVVYSHDIDITIPLQPGERLYMDCFLGGPSVETRIEFLEVEEKDRLKCEFKNKFRDTYTKAFRPYDLYRKICVRAGIESNDVVSDLLKQCTFFVTCGDAIRGLDGAQVKTMYNDFFKAMNVYLMIGGSVEQQRVIMEQRSRFYDSSNPIPLGEVILNEVSEANDLLFSSIKIGHDEQDIDSVNGKFDFNGWHIYSTAVKRIGSKQLDLQSPWSASPYEIEKKRSGLDGKKTTDDNGDNKVYVLDVDILGSSTDVLTHLSFTTLFGNNTIIAPLGPIYISGQRIRITGSASNDFIFTIVSVASNLIGNFIEVVELVTDEIDVPVQLTFLTGQVYEYDRSTIVDSGVPSPSTIFNVRLNPYLLLKKHLSWIHSCLDKYEDSKIKFESGNMNNDLVVGGIKMGSDINVSDMPPKMFKPIRFDITAPTPIELPDLMNDNPNRCFSFISKSKLYIGLPNSVAMAADIRPQDFILLSIDQNLETLIINNG